MRMSGRRKAFYTNKQQIKVLLEEKGCDSNDADYDGRSPLHLACEEGHLDVVKYLITHSLFMCLIDYKHILSFGRS